MVSSKLTPSMTAESKASFAKTHQVNKLGATSGLIFSLIILAGHGLFLWRVQKAFDADPSASDAFDFVGLWTPVFLLSIFVEWIFIRSNFFVSDSINSIATGALMVLTKKMLVFAFSVSPYVLSLRVSIS